MRTQNMQCPPFALGCEMQFIPARLDQSLRFDVFDQSGGFIAGYIQCPRNGFGCGMPALIFTVEQVFESWCK